MIGNSHMKTTVEVLAYKLNLFCCLEFTDTAIACDDLDDDNTAFASGRCSSLRLNFNQAIQCMTFVNTCTD